MPTKQSEDSFSMIIDDWNLVYTLYLIIFFFSSPPLLFYRVKIENRKIDYYFLKVEIRLHESVCTMITTYK